MEAGEPSMDRRLAKGANQVSRSLTQGGGINECLLRHNKIIALPGENLQGTAQTTRETNHQMDGLDRISPFGVRQSNSPSQSVASTIQPAVDRNPFLMGGGGHFDRSKRDILYAIINC